MTLSPIVKFAAISVLTGSLMACSSNPKIEALAEPVTPAPLEFTTTSRGPMVTLDDVLFDFEKASLRTEADTIVRQAAAFLKDNPGRTAIIEGHTDHTGDSAYNQMLSMARSNSVRESLVRYGVGSKRIRTRGYGEARPVASNATVIGRQTNRRVEIIFQTTNTLANRHSL